MIAELLDRTLAALRSEQPVGPAIEALCDGLLVERARLGPAWLGVVEHVCRRHPLHVLLGQDPFTAQARRKPRAGDATLIDYLYDAVAGPDTTALGEALMRATTSGALGRAIRARRTLLARRIDDRASRVERPRILAVACGHLRELAVTASAGELGAVYAIDHDPDNLAEAARHPQVVPIAASVGDLLRGPVDVPACDLVYAAGLYEYLPDGVAGELTQCLFERVAPGGELLIASFAAEPPPIGYMEAFMDWSVLGRSEATLRALGARLATDALWDLHTWLDDERCLAYLSATRAP